MCPTTYITTSWDDGHPLDLRVAELLTKYGIRGTFYVPRSAERSTMTAAHIRQICSTFEIGAHTLHHVVLTNATEQAAWQEISISKAWVEDTTGSRCVLFCPPKGRYTARHLTMIRDAGYLGLRTTELISLDFPRRQSGLLLMPTTVQAYPHSTLALVKNAIKRTAFGNLWRLVVDGRSTEWPTRAQSLLLRALQRGGVFHLWGHSWELQDVDQWRRLEELLRFMSWFVRQAPTLTNGEICQCASSPTGSIDDDQPEPVRSGSIGERALLTKSFISRSGLQ